MLAEKGAVRLFFALAVLASAASCAPSPRRVGDDAALVRSELRKPHTAAEREKILRPSALSSIGQMATIDGLDPEPVIGFGLVTGLGSKGGEKSGLPREIVREVRKNLIREETRTLPESAQLLAAADSSVVEVRGAIPPAAAVGDTFDVLVRPLDNASTLQDGYLHTVPLAPYVSSNGGLTRGEAVARAQGQVAAPSSSAGGLVHTGGPRRTGMVFDGGRCGRERVLLVRLKEQYVSGRRSVLIEYLINRRLALLDPRPGAAHINYALALSDRTVRLHVPGVYRRFVHRFADMIRSIEGDYFYGPPSDSWLAGCLRTLEQGDPEEKYLASVRLEAVGAAAVPYLERASGDDRTALYSGQALAYLNSEAGRTRIIKAADSSLEEVRFEAVKFLANLAGRSVVQALRAKVFDPSDRISLEAVRGLVRQGEEYARRLRLPGYDIVALRGLEPGLIVKSGGRPQIVVSGIGTPLEGSVEVRVGDFGLGSTDASHVGVISAAGDQPQTQVVEATVDNVIAALAMYDVPFDDLRRIIAQMEDSGHFPFDVTWMD